MSAFPDFAHQIEDVIENGNKVVLRGIFTGTHKGTFNGIAATNKSVSASWIDISEYDTEGKVINEWVELDTMGMMQQLGVIPAQ